MGERILETVLREFKELLGKQLESIDLMGDETTRCAAILEYRRCQVRLDSLMEEFGRQVRVDGNSAFDNADDLGRHNSETYARNYPLLASASLRTRLIRLSTPVAMPKGSVLFRRNEPAFGAFLIRQGAVSLRLEGEDGDVVVERICRPGAVLGLPANLSKGRYGMSAIALQPCELAFVSHRDLLHCLQNDPGAGIELLKVAGDEIINLHIILASMPQGERVGSA